MTLSAKRKLLNEIEYKYKSASANDILILRIYVNGLGHTPEYIVNYKDNWRLKAAYIDEAYNEDLQLKNKTSIYIESYRFKRDYEGSFL